jgi:hypothetical protein
MMGRTTLPHDWFKEWMEEKATFSRENFIKRWKQYKVSTLDNVLMNYRRQGLIHRVAHGGYEWGAEQNPDPEPSTVYDALQIGNSVVDLVNDLRSRVQALTEERDELKELMDDYDRIVDENRVLKERMNDLHVKYGAANRKELRL